MKGSKIKKLICFIGIDGSGKTTCSINLYNKLKALGFSCRYVHHTYSIINNIPKMLRLCIRNFVLSISGASVPVESAKDATEGSRSERPIALFSIAILLDSLIGRFTETKSNFGESITIYDRYFYDQIVNVAECLGTFPNWLTECYLRLIPKPDLVFLLDLPPIVAHQRKAEGPVGVYERRRELYLSLTKRLDMTNLIIINALQDPDEISALIFGYVRKLLEVGG